MQIIFNPDEKITAMIREGLMANSIFQLSPAFEAA